MEETKGKITSSSSAEVSVFVNFCELRECFAKINDKIVIHNKSERQK